MSKLETNTIDTVSGTSTLQVGSTNTSTITLGVSGDTINVPSGVTIANSGTATGFGGAMTPAFFAYLGGSGGQSVSTDTVTKVTINAEVFDTDNAFDSSSNYRFTPQTAGKYFVHVSIMADSGSSSNLRENYIYLKKNGSTYIFQGSTSFESNYIRQHVITNAAVVDMNGSSDYLELFGRIKVDSGTPLFESNTQWGQITNFGAYRIIT